MGLDRSGVLLTASTLIVVAILQSNWQSCALGAPHFDKGCLAVSIPGATATASPSDVAVGVGRISGNPGEGERRFRSAAGLPAGSGSKTGGENLKRGRTQVGPLAVRS